MYFITIIKFYVFSEPASKNVLKLGKLI